MGTPRASQSTRWRTSSGSVDSTLVHESIGQGDLREGQLVGQAQLLHHYQGLPVRTRLRAAPRRDPVQSETDNQIEVGMGRWSLLRETSDSRPRRHRGIRVSLPPNHASGVKNGGNQRGWGFNGIPAGNYSQTVVCWSSKPRLASIALLIRAVTTWAARVPSMTCSMRRAL